MMLHWLWNQVVKKAAASNDRGVIDLAISRKRLGSDGFREALISAAASGHREMIDYLALRSGYSWGETSEL